MSSNERAVVIRKNSSSQVTSTGYYLRDGGQVKEEVLIDYNSTSGTISKIKTKAYLYVGANAATTEEASYYSISGRIAANGVPLSGVTVSAINSSNQSASAISDANGYYSIILLTNGIYKVVPSLSGYSFVPMQYTNRTISNASISNLNFTWNKLTTFTISGSVTQFLGNNYAAGSGYVGVPGVQIVARKTTTPYTQNSATTGVNGAYVITGLVAGTYSVAASKTGCTFSPTSKTITISTSNVGSANYTATCASYYISGYITDDQNKAITGISVSLSGNSSAQKTTDGNGYYIFGGLQNGSYTVSVGTDPCYNFAETSQPVIVTGGNETGVNFTGVFGNCHTISGNVVAYCSPLQGVTVTASSVSTGSKTATSDSSGNYTFPPMQSGAYTLTPSKSGYTFTPSSHSATIIDTDITGKSFTGDEGDKILTSGSTVQGSVCSNNYHYYRVNVPSGATKLVISLTNLSANVDLYDLIPPSVGGTAGRPSTTTKTSVSKLTGTQAETITENSPRAGNWGIAAFGNAVNGTYSITATVTTSTITYSISGTIFNSAGGVLSGVTVTTGAVTTSSGTDGTYTLSGLSNGTYTVTPSKTGYAFNPTSTSVTISSANATLKNFAGTAIPSTGYTLSLSADHCTAPTATPAQTIYSPGSTVTINALASCGSNCYNRWSFDCFDLGADGSCDNYSNQYLYTFPSSGSGTVKIAAKYSSDSCYVTNLTASDYHEGPDGKYQILLTWEDDNLAAGKISYEIAQKNLSSFVWDYSTLVTAEDIAPGYHSYLITPPTGCDIYTYQVRAYSEETGIFSPWSEAVDARATATIPNPPVWASVSCIGRDLNSPLIDMVNFIVDANQACSYTNIFIASSPDGVNWTLPFRVQANGGTFYSVQMARCGTTKYKISTAIGDAVSSSLFVTRSTIPMDKPKPMALTSNLSQADVTIGDISGDQIYDVVLQNAYFKTNSDGTFTDASSELNTTAGSGDRVRLSDLNSDGYLDRVIASKDSIWVEMNGEYGFTLGSSISLDEPINDFAIGYPAINADGMIKIAAGSKTKITILSYEQSSGFVLSDEIQTQIDISSIALGDLNNDGFIDILCGGKNGLSYFYVTEDNTRLWLEEKILSNLAVSSIDIADANKDGFLDVAIGRQAKDAPLVYLFEPSLEADPTLRPLPHTWNPGFIDSTIDLPNVRQVVFCDLDGGGLPGLFCVTEEAQKSQYLKNNGNGGMLQTQLILSNKVTAVAVGDFDNDGLLDFAAVGVNILDIYKGSEIIAGTQEEVKWNDPPAPPSVISTDVQGEKLLLEWRYGSDDITLPISLTYEVYAGTEQGVTDIFLGEVGPAYTSSKDGNRKTANKVEIPFPEGMSSIYWGIRSIDSTLQKGDWIEGMLVRDSFGNVESSPTSRVSVVEPSHGKVVSHHDIDSIVANPSPLTGFINSKALNLVQRAAVPDRHLGESIDNTADSELNATSESAIEATAIPASTISGYYYSWDHLGTVRVVSKDTGIGTAIVVSKHDYEPYGIELPSAQLNPSANTHQFTGHERDTNTGLDNMHFRYYSSTMGRFMKPDNIIGNLDSPQSFNRYSYVKGNPVNFNDPSGHMPATYYRDGIEVGTIELDPGTVGKTGADDYMGIGTQKSQTIGNKSSATDDPGILLNDMTNGLLIFVTMDFKGNTLQYTYQAGTYVTSDSEPGAQNGFITPDVSWRRERNDPRYGPNGSYIWTNDYRFRVIHGGYPLFQGPTDPYGAPLENSPSKNTRGCTRAGNSDVYQLAAIIMDFKNRTGENVPFLRYGTPPGATHQNRPYFPSDHPMIKAILEGRLWVYPIGPQDKD